MLLCGPERGGGSVEGGPRTGCGCERHPRAGGGLDAFYGILDRQRVPYCVPFDGDDTAFGAGTGCDQHLIFLGYVCLNGEKHGFAHLQLGGPLRAGNAQGRGIVGKGEGKVGADGAILGGKAVKTEEQKGKEDGTHDWNNVLKCQ